MSEQARTVRGEELQAYVDGRLTGARYDRVAGAVAADPELARCVNELRSLADAVHAAYDGMLDEPVPPAQLRTALSRRPLLVAQAAPAVLWMTLGGVIGGLAVDQLAPGRGDDAVAARPLPREAAYAHAIYVREGRHAVEVGADDSAHLNAWLSKRLAHPVTAPDLRDAGYQLVGGRLLPDAGQPAAQFMYEDAQRGRLTLYVRGHAQHGASTAFRYEESTTLGVVYWVDGPLAYALTGSAQRAELQRIAEAMYRALNP